jgi:hypothetical protein
MKVKIGAIEFPTKQKATVHVSALLNKYSLGQVVEAADHEFLLALLSRHHEHEAKEGCGVAYFTRGQHPEYKKPCFLLHRLDGSSTDFSTVTCINGQGPSLMAEWREACRQAVDARVLAAKNVIYDADEGRVVCPDSGEVLEKGEYWLVQVNPSWSEMVDQFIAANALQPSRDDVTEPADNQYWAEFKDRELARKFAGFHAPLMNLVPKRVTV